MSDPRGVRNCNPGNIRRSSTHWQGMRQEQTDPDFVQFETPEYGIRAMSKILDSYARRGIVTVQDIINTWAPPSENDTAGYINSVCQCINLSPFDQVCESNREFLIAAIIKHENGVQPYAAATIESGVALA